MRPTVAWASSRTDDFRVFQRRAIGHLGVCLLARVDGTSPVEYLPEEPKREAVRRLARRLLLQPPKGIADVLQLADEELAHLA